ncbi:hypothetical protein CH251_02955 [Rhodococcus sp. 06-462-5]|uniref:hypothetical protein n=1 Tax=unclassified Rhodococcus (in: high G+C Gram-positive bacteria) TaxID=192944 RepID=UPI000B9BD715|nr:MULTISPECIES: hypothetical protein [unclassified Rhodococcus (in: high G+C Gram-positive bacteria)]OZC78717.1 hypothetical protein CH251_02955 [Rhodococcus sp. 06-462-5]OZE62009.1 hypothetical protein CH270_20220 [Rhodococcus sp. 02-925g]
MKKNKTDRVGRDDSATEERNSSRRGPSALLLLAGLAAMVVSVAALIGQGAIAALGDVQFRWVFVVAAVVVGFALLLGPSRKN